MFLSSTSHQVAYVNATALFKMMNENSSYASHDSHEQIVMKKNQIPEISQFVRYDYDVIRKPCATAAGYAYEYEYVCTCVMFIACRMICMKNKSY